MHFILIYIGIVIVTSLVLARFSKSKYIVPIASMCTFLLPSPVIFLVAFFTYGFIDSNRTQNYSLLITSLLFFALLPTVAINYRLLRRRHPNYQLKPLLGTLLAMIFPYIVCILFFGIASVYEAQQQANVKILTKDINSSPPFIYKFDKKKGVSLSYSKEFHTIITSVTATGTQPGYYNISNRLGTVSIGKCSQTAEQLQKLEKSTEEIVANYSIAELFQCVPDEANRKFLVNSLTQSNASTSLRLYSMEGYLLPWVNNPLTNNLDAYISADVSQSLYFNYIPGGQVNVLNRNYNLIDSINLNETHKKPTQQLKLSDGINPIEEKTKE